MGHLKPGISNPPAAFEISSEVLDFNSAFALLCAATIKSSIITLSSFIISSDKLIFTGPLSECVFKAEKKLKCFSSL